MYARPLPCACGDTCLIPAPDRRGFSRENADHLPHGGACRRFDDSLGQRLESPAPRLQIIQKGDEITQWPAKPVKLPGRQLVAGLEGLKTPCQRRLFGGRSLNPPPALARRAGKPLNLWGGLFLFFMGLSLLFLRFVAGLQDGVGDFAQDFVVLCRFIRTTRKPARARDVTCQALSADGFTQVGL